MKDRDYETKFNRGDEAGLSEEGRDYDRPDHVRGRTPAPAPVKKEPKRAGKKKKKSMNRQFLFVTYVTVLLFLGMMGYLVYFNAVRSEQFISSPYNPRLDAFADRVIRGSILSSNGDVLAKTTVGEDGSEVREYPYGSMFAHAVGFASNGQSGLELEENFALTTSHAFFPEKIKNELAGKKNVGDNVVTTLDTTLQQAAYDALGDNRGAVIAIDPKTGAIKAMVSKPDFDPNTVSQDWEALNADEGNQSTLLNRAISGAYAPGSTFKIATALAFIRQDKNYPAYTYDCEGSITNGDTTIECFNHTVHGHEDLTGSFANSCNSSFANIGLMLNVDEYRDTCEELLFNKTLPCPLGARKSQFTLDSKSSAGKIMMTAMGQGDTLVSPYHMALITSAIANDGVLMKPYLVEKIENYTGSTVRKTKPSEYKTLMTKGEADKLTELMTAVVQQGTGIELSGASYTAAGKTGTAEYSSDKSLSHSWYTGFSNVEDPDLVVCVIVEGYDGNPGGRAVPVAKQVFDAYYNR